MTIEKSFRTVAVAAVFCFAVTLSAFAQPAYPAPAVSDVWSANLGDQLARSLVSPVPAIKAQALHQTTYYAQFHGAEIDLTATVPALIAIYEKDASEEARVAAVAALYALGDENGMQRLRAAVRIQPSAQVRLAALGALMDYYGPATFAGDAELAAMARELSEALETQYEVAVPQTMAASR
jgi:hypothetical protein